MIVSDFFRWALNKFMKKSIYDANDNNIIDKAEALNDGSFGDGNNVTASEARSHIDNNNINKSITKDNEYECYIIQ